MKQLDLMMLNIREGYVSEALQLSDNVQLLHQVYQVSENTRSEVPLHFLISSNSLCLQRLQSYHQHVCEIFRPQLKQIEMQSKVPSSDWAIKVPCDWAIKIPSNDCAIKVPSYCHNVLTRSEFPTSAQRPAASDGCLFSRWTWMWNMFHFWMIVQWPYFLTFLQVSNALCEYPHGF